MARIPIALQLWSVRKDCERDLPATLAALSKMGYEGVEFAGYYGRSAAELRQICDDVGLQVAGSHVGLNTLQGDELPRSIEFHQALGNRFLIVPWMDPKELQTRAAWVEFAHVLDEIGERLRPHEMHTGYHNHTHEFRPLEGEAPWDILAANSNPEVVMQLDLGNAAHGGGEPLSLLRHHVDRALTLHLKEYSSTDPEPLVGGGEIPWADVFSIAEDAGKTQWYIVEQEVYPYPPLESAERSLKFLREMGK